MVRAMHGFLAEFKMGKLTWHILTVSPNDAMLVDRTGRLRLATTDPMTKCIYLSERLGGEMLRHVLIHELAHCVIVSYGYLEDIHKLTKKRYWVESEEWICNIIANHSKEVLGIANDILGG